MMIRVPGDAARIRLAMSIAGTLPWSSESIITTSGFSVVT